MTERLIAHQKTVECFELHARHTDRDPDNTSPGSSSTNPTRQRLTQPRKAHAVALHGTDTPSLIYGMSEFAAALR